jgi:MFS family permease
MDVGSRRVSLEIRFPRRYSALLKTRPEALLTLCRWYKKQEQALRMGAWYSSTGYVSIVSPLINYGIGHIHGALSSWRYMYIVAGSITIVWSFVILWLMPPDPIRAKGFTERERYIAVARMKINNSGVVSSTRIQPHSSSRHQCPKKFIATAHYMLTLGLEKHTFQESSTERTSGGY